MAGTYQTRPRWIVEVSDECCETLVRLRDTSATADVLAELLVRLETRAHVGTPVAGKPELRIIRSAGIVLDGEYVPAIRVVYGIEPDGLPADYVLAMDVAYVGSDEDIIPSDDDPQHLSLHDH